MSDIQLTTKLVGKIEGRFFIPSYQRGYRWSKKEVELLLNDILSSGDKPYCLQPIVVKALDNNHFELVDGQQRITTIFLIYKYFHKCSNGFLNDAKFTLEYQTRKQSQQYLSNIDLTRRNENIDFWFIANAYETIEQYFVNKEKSVMTELNKYFDRSVSVIWYEIPQSENAIDLFTRLNIGKIPLTSSELVKALFLRENAENTKQYQEEISLQWDNIECDLHDTSLWSFLTNNKASNYPTRINLLLDLIANRAENEKDEHFTFFHFDKKAKDGISLYDVWKEIQHTFLILKEWRYNHELYHKIGYLIASGSKSLKDIYDASKGNTKSTFKKYLDKEIKESLNFKKEYGELSYDNDHDLIERLLFLFNIESVRTLDDGKQWFPFDKHKKNASWSLEHIHAQHSEGLESNEKKKIWLADHLAAVKTLHKEDTTDLIRRMENLIINIEENSKTTKVRELFDPIQKDVANLFTQEAGEYIHNIGNMALLDCGDNAALSNYVFDAKRNMIIEWDKQGKYIPFCTKMVFFKYYTSSENNQLHYWGIKDRQAYINAINDKLSPYLNGIITSEND